MTHTRINHTEDGDTGVLKWGETGGAHTYRIGDDEGLMTAYRKAVAEALVGGETFEDDVERSIARELSESIGISFQPREEMAGLTFEWDSVIEDPRTLRKDVGDSLIVGWFPQGDTLDALTALQPTATTMGSPALDTGYPLHLTIAFLGDPAQMDAQLVAAVTKLFTRWREPLDGCVSGIGRFVGPEDTDVIVALVDIPGLGDLRHRLKDSLLCEGGVPYDSPLWNETHGFVPHITLAYVPKSTPMSSLPELADAIPVKLDSLTLSYGADTSATFPLGMTYGNAMATPEEAMLPYYAAREAVSLHKAGRVLSGKNMASLKEAIAALQAVHDSAVKLSETDDDEGAGADMAKRRTFLAAIAGKPEPEYQMQYLVTKATAEKRFTLGPLYAPMRMDAHGEFTRDDTLQDATHAWIQECFDKGSNRLNLQHGDLGDIQVANVVEVMAWPYDHTISVTKADGGTEELEMPAGTVYLGAIWDEDAWPLVKSGKLNGWSLGGKAVRVSAPGEDLPDMGYKLAAAAKPVAKDMAAHAYVEEDGVCKMCQMSRAEGNHTAEKSATALDAEETAALLAAAHETEVALAVARTEAAVRGEEAEKTRGVFAQVLDTIKGRREPDIHVHLPEQNVTINEAPSALDALLEE